MDQQLWLEECLHGGSLGELQCWVDSLGVVEVHRVQDSRTGPGRVLGVPVADSLDNARGAVGNLRDRVVVHLAAVEVLPAAAEVHQVVVVVVVVAVDGVVQLDLLDLVVVVGAVAVAGEDLHGIQDLIVLVVAVEAVDWSVEVAVGCAEH